MNKLRSNINRPANKNKLTTLFYASLIATTMLMPTWGIAQNNDNWNKSKNKTEISIKQNIDHEKIINTLPEEILKQYGEKEWLKTIQQHTLQEINKIRKQNNLKPIELIEHISQKGQDYATYMALTWHLSHKTKDWVCVADLINYNQEETYTIVDDNIWYWIMNIKEFIKWQMDSKLWHKEIILEENYNIPNIYKYFGLWYKDWYRIIIFANK